MTDLSQVLRDVERRRKTIEVYAPSVTTADELAVQFETRNVDVVHHGVPTALGPGFVVVRDADGRFQGALGIDHLDAVLSPDVHPPWVLDDAVDPAALFSFLQNTIFTAYDRMQMLAAAREIEERAWRANRGVLHVGFQRAAALQAQLPVYERLHRETDLDLRLSVADEWAPADADVPAPITDASAEIGRFWFVLFDGGGSRYDACGLLAEERDPGSYYGFWTYEPDLVDEMTDALPTPERPD